jgi:hypothetical protein
MIRNSLKAFVLGMALLLTGVTGNGPDRAAAQGCLSQGEARKAVQSGQAAPFSAFSGGLRSQGQIVSSCMAGSDGNYSYVVQLVQSNGQVTRVVLDARTGARR